jgi:hypothetical protein
MKKANPKTADELRPEYKRSDFGELVRGKYYKRYTESSNVVVLDPDVARRFRNAEAVNSALRQLMNGKARNPVRTTRPRKQATRR